MNTSKRLTFVMSSCGVALLVNACASPTDPLVGDDPVEMETALTGDGESTSAPSCDSKDEGGQAEQSSALTARDCNYGDSWHCTIAHQGWRWVPLEDAGQRPPGMGTRCCVLVGPETRPRPGRVI